MSETSGAAERRARALKGLPKYTEADLRHRAASRQKRQESGYERARKRRQKQALRDLLAQIKLERGCVDCGYRAHAEALDFDHLPGHTKRLSVGGLCSNGVREAMLAEIEKCEVVCANCHRVRTSKRRLAAKSQT